MTVMSEEHACRRKLCLFIGPYEARSEPTAPSAVVADLSSMLTRLHTSRTDLECSAHLVISMLKML